MKRNMRSYERQVAVLTNDRIPQFIEDQRYNCGQRKYNSFIQLHKIDFHEENIIYYGGTMNFAYKIFEKMCRKQVVHRGVTYKCGIRNIRFCKITVEDEKAVLCLANCDTCFRSAKNLCDRVVGK